jgi:hypothetical protein
MNDGGPRGGGALPIVGGVMIPTTSGTDRSRSKGWGRRRLG